MPFRSPLQHVEKAIGVTHLEMKHPACCTTVQKSFLNLQDFFVSYNLHSFLFRSFVWQGHVAGLLTKFARWPAV